MPTRGNMDELIGFNFTIQETNTVIKGLLELPAKESMNLILKIQNTAQQKINELNAGKTNLKVEKNDG